MRPIAATTLIVLAAACTAGRASAPGVAPAVATEDPLAEQPWHPQVGHQDCVALDPPVTSVEQLVDSAGFAAAIAPAADGMQLWTVAFDGNGRIANVRVLESTHDAVEQARLTDALRSTLKHQAAEAYVRLRLDGSAGATRMRTGGAQYCQAALVNLDAVRNAMGAVDRTGQIELQLYIDQQGRVQERQIVRSSGVESTDRRVLGLVSTFEYSPARLERLAVPSRLTYHVDLDQR